MSGLAWAQWMVMALLWAGGFNALGAARLRRRHTGATGQSLAHPDNLQYRSG
jgi:hypothetical protein